MRSGRISGIPITVISTRHLNGSVPMRLLSNPMDVARHVAHEWNANGNCALVIGATYPDEMKTIRAVADDLPFLIPGIGAQGGDLQKTVQAGRDSRGRGMIISAARSIIFAGSGEDFFDAARESAKKLDAEIRGALK